MTNIFAALPNALHKEIFEDIVNTDTVRIERIISHGQSSPETGWYDQDENEWVIVLAGEATLAWENGDEVILTSGDYVLIPAHQRHRVISTKPDAPTIWLAIFFQ